MGGQFACGYAAQGCWSPRLSSHHVNSWSPADKTYKSRRGICLGCVLVSLGLLISASHHLNGDVKYIGPFP